MVNHPPEHCPRCGAGLEPIDPPTVHRCPACAEPVFYNPTPSARVLVLETGEASEVEHESEATTDRDDGDVGADGGGGDGGDPPQASGHDPDEPRVLLVTRPDGVWITPGGAIEAGAQPREHAARELREETGLDVAVGDLRYVLGHAVEPVPGKRAVYLEYDAHRADTTGPPRAGDDASDAAFVSPAAFRASDRELQASQHATLDGDLDRRLAAARAALERPPVRTDHGTETGHAGKGRRHQTGGEGEEEAETEPGTETRAGTETDPTGGDGR